MQHSEALRDLRQLGWCRFAADPQTAAWAEHARDVALGICEDPKHISDWLRCGGTWFAGVNILPNGRAGVVGSDGPELRGPSIEMVNLLYGTQKWDQAQLSVMYPGYPQPMAGESAAAFDFRKNRDAAHVDGLLPIGPERRRHLREPHGFVLGVPLTKTSVGASPMVIWEGSHIHMRNAFRTALDDLEPKHWVNVDLTHVYQETRRRCFETCNRVTIHAQPGEAYLVDRLALHGVAPWEEGASAPPEGRIIAYFRPELEDISDWLA